MGKNRGGSALGRLVRRAIMRPVCFRLLAPPGGFYATVSCWNTLGSDGYAIVWSRHRGYTGL
jgi:hypothetical protein